METKKSVLKNLMKVTSFVSVISLMGCAQNSEEVWPTNENPTILDEVHHRDLIHMSDLELPQPVDRSLDISEEEASRVTPTTSNETVPARRERVAVTQPRQSPPQITAPKIEAPAEKPQSKPEAVKPEVKPEAKTEAKPEVKPETKPEQKAQEPVVTAKEGKGSVYYIPVFTHVRRCEEQEQVHLRDISGRILALLCKKEIADCAMQGSCYYSNSKEIKLFAYRKLVEIKDPKTGNKYKEPRFVVNQEHSRCPHGMGFRRICLDPYRSVAADMKFHKAGDVFYIPVLKGQILPNGEEHDGYVVVRDIGGAILGEGRFDFFIGFDSYVGHVFSKLNLSNPNRSTFTYYPVSKERAEQVRKLRAYPQVPGKVHDRALSALSRPQGKEESRAAMSQFDISTAFFATKYFEQ